MADPATPAAPAPNAAGRLRAGQSPARDTDRLVEFVSRLFGSRDLVPDQFPAVGWDGVAAATALEEIRGYVAREGREAAEWYIRKRSLKRRFGQATRLAAMFAIAAAGVLPVLAQILGQSGQYAFPPAWATVLLAAAALLVGLDYFFGFTSGWIRYLEAEQKIARALYELHFDWEIVRTAWAGRAPTPEEVRGGLRRLKEAMLQLHQIVQDETAAWAAEFRSTIQRLDEAARARAEAGPPAPGATVTLTNGAGVGEWTLAVDDGAAVPGTGARRALLGLRPGPHKFVAEGEINGQPARDEVTAEIRPTGVTEVGLTLR